MRATAAAALATALLLAGCGGSSTSTATLYANGRGSFRSAGCGTCHTLAAAGARGNAGPDFDTSEKLTRAQIIQALNSGSGDMPSFRSRLTDRQEKALAEFLFAATHRR